MNTHNEPVLDVTIPNAARVYDYLLGGGLHWQADRDLARELVKWFPGHLLRRGLIGRLLIGWYVSPSAVV